MKDFERKWEYGMPSGEYEKMYHFQEGKCKICDKSFKTLCVDHNHKSGKIRSLLCKKCNSCLGFIDEDPHLLEKAILYLQAHMTF